MTIKTWLDTSLQDADRRNLPGLRPLLETLARATSALRSADWNFDATGEPPSLLRSIGEPRRGSTSTPDVR
jgi:hypothetical protein